RRTTDRRPRLEPVGRTDGAGPVAGFRDIADVGGLPTDRARGSGHAPVRGFAGACGTVARTHVRRARDARGGGSWALVPVGARVAVVARRALGTRDAARACVAHGAGAAHQRATAHALARAVAVVVHRAGVAVVTRAPRRDAGAAGRVTEREG